MNAKVVKIFLGGPDAVSSDTDVLARIRDRCGRVFNNIKAPVQIVVRRYREPPNILHPVPGVDVQDRIDAEIDSDVYDFAIFVFRDRLGTPHPDGQRSYSVRELEKAIELRRRSGAAQGRPLIFIYKARRSWRQTEERVLATLTAAACDELVAKEQTRQAQHINVYSYLEMMRSSPEFGKLYTVFEEENDDNIVDGVIEIIESYIRNLPGPINPEPDGRDRGWPYPGIGDYAIADWEIFKGRDEKIAECFVQIHAGRRIITICGGMGSGKTSLLQAGVLGNLRYGSENANSVNDVYIDVEPGTGGQDFFDKIATEFEHILRPKHGSARNSSRIRAALDSMFVTPRAGFDCGSASAEFDNQFVRILLDASARRNGRLVLSINQAEHCMAEASPMRTPFARFLATAGMVDSVLVLMTLRDEAYGRLRSDPVIERNAGSLIAPIWLSPPDAVELVKMIEEPARFAALQVEPKLVRRICRDATGKGDVLPLVAQCLHALRTRAKNRVLSFSDYEDIGGLEGVVIGQARELEDLTTSDVLSKFFDALVGPGAGEAIERRSVPRGALLDLGIPEGLLKKGLEFRLLQEADTHAAGAIRLQHDILFQAWPSLKAHIDARRPVFEQRRALMDDAKRWSRSGGDDRNLRVNEEMLDAIDWESLLGEFDEDARLQVAGYVRAAKRKAARTTLVAAVNAGLPSDIRKALAAGAVLTEAERGDGVGQLRPQFWAAVTGDDRMEEDLYIDRRHVAGPGRGGWRSIFEDAALVRSCVTRGMSVLHIAALCGRTDLVRRLVVDHSADPWGVSERGGDALSYAAYGGARDICIFFIEECGVRFGGPDSDGASAAIWATQQSHRDLARYLTSFGYPDDVTITGGWNRLTETIFSGDLEGVAAALAEGYSPHEPTEGGLTPALVACYHLRADILQYLIERHDVDLTLRDGGGQTALDLICVGAGNISRELRRERIEATLDIALTKLPIETLGFGGERPLVRAVSLGAIEVAEALLNRGAAREGISPSNTIPLFTAIVEGEVGIAKLLLASGANPNATGPLRMHALHLAAARGSADMVDLLLVRPNVQTDVCDDRGMTPLQFAAGLGHLEVVRDLMDHGASPRLVSAAGDALTAALNIASEPVVRMLLRDRLDADRLFERASDRAVDPSIDEEVGHLAWPNRIHLTQAAMTGRSDLIELLMRAGIDPNDQDAVGDTMLHDVVRLRAGSMAAVQMILPYMRDLSVVNAGGYTAADLALAADHEDVAKLLTIGDAEPIWWGLPKVSEGLPFFSFVDVDGETEKWLDQRLAALGTWSRVPPEARSIRMCRLPFYTDAWLVTMEHTERRGPREQFALIRPGREFLPMNWSNAPVYLANDRWSLSLTESDITDYVSWFFHMVRGHLGRFSFVDSAEQFRWLGEAPEETMAKIDVNVRPLTIEHFKAGDRAVLSGTVLFKNALFFTKIMVALEEQTMLLDGEEELMTRGQLKLFGEELLVEDLPVYVPPPPSTWG